MSWTKLEGDLYLYHIFSCSHLELNISSPALCAVYTNQILLGIAQNKEILLLNPSAGLCLLTKSSGFPQQSEDKLWKRMAQPGCPLPKHLVFLQKSRNIIRRGNVWGGFLSVVSPLFSDRASNPRCCQASNLCIPTISAGAECCLSASLPFQKVFLQLPFNILLPEHSSACSQMLGVSKSSRNNPAKLVWDPA